MTTTVPDLALRRIVLDITGMTCAACVRRVEGALRRVDGVRAAAVNLATRQASADVEAGRIGRAELEAAVIAAGYGVLASPPEHSPGATGRSEAEQAERRSLLRDLATAAAATAPLLLLGMSHGLLPFAEATAGRVVQFVLGSIVLFVPGRRFLRGGATALRHRNPDMNTLVALGAVVAWLWSTIATFGGVWRAHEGHAAPHVYFEAVGAIVTFVLLGKFLESRTRWRLGDAVRALHALVPAVAHRVDGDAAADEADVPVTMLRRGDTVRVRPGERVPADGIVVQGASAVDESLLTGESTPIDKEPGDRVVGGSMNTTGALLVRVERTGAQTALAGIAAAVEAAQGSRPPIARFADVASGVFVPIVLAIAAITFAVWWLLEPTAGGFAVAIEHAVAVLVIACPCALGLATPAAVAVGAGRGAELGVLFRTGAAIEEASRIDTVFLDKTGTLTNGTPTLVALEPTGELGADAILRLAAAVEVASEHPFARAIVEAARTRAVPLPAVRSFAATPAMGVAAQVDGQLVRVGKPQWLAAQGVDTSGVVSRLEAMARTGVTPLLVSQAGTLVGILGLADRLRPESGRVVERLRGMGVRVGVLTGDRSEVAAAVTAPLAIDEVVAGLLPAAKAAHVARRRSPGRAVAMVGDGINDAPALAAADVGIVVGSGTDVAAAAADVALMHGGLAGVPIAVELARATMRTIRRNLVWASVYNVLGIPLAAGALTGLGIALSPVYASAAMSLSSVSVLLSSLRLRRFRPTVDGEVRR